MIIFLRHLQIVSKLCFLLTELWMQADYNALLARTCWLLSAGLIGFPISWAWGLMVSAHSNRSCPTQCENYLLCQAWQWQRWWRNLAGYWFMSRGPLWIREMDKYMWEHLGCWAEIEMLKIHLRHMGIVVGYWQECHNDKVGVNVKRTQSEDLQAWLGAIDNILKCLATSIFWHIYQDAVKNVVCVLPGQIMPYVSLITSHTSTTGGAKREIQWEYSVTTLQHYLQLQKKCKGTMQ